MKQIPVNHRRKVATFALVDDADYEWLSTFTWRLSQYGYPQTTFRATNGKQYSIRMHQMLLPRHLTLLIDHANQNKLDNRRCNLRHVNASENSRNTPQRKSAKGFRGVYFQNQLKGRPWVAMGNYLGKQYNLGRFATAKEASIAAVNFADRARNAPETIKGSLYGKCSNPHI